MKRLALFTAALMILSFGLASAQTDVLDLAGDPVGSWDSGTKVNTNTPITFTIHMTVGTAAIQGMTNGFEVFVADAPGSIAGAYTFDPISYDTLIDLKTPYLDGGWFFNAFPNPPDGNGADTIGFGGFSLFASGIPVGFDEDVYIIGTQVSDADEGRYLCIDSAFYPPGSPWLWSVTGGINVYPDWNGPYCYEIATIPNLPPEFDNCPGAQLSFDHCNVASYDLDATDPEGDPFTFAMVSGPGTIDAATGVWSYNPTLADVGAAQTVVVEVSDGQATQCSFDVVFTNQPPTITCQGIKQVGKGNPINVQITGDDVDCDPGTFSIVSVNPAPVGAYSIDPNTGLLNFMTDVADGGIVYDFEIEYTDGVAAATCIQQIDVLEVEPYEIQIQKTHGTFQGQHEYVDVSVNLGSEQMWGFDMLIAYDASALSFQAAIEGTVYDACGWEYFTYRYGADGNCSNACPSGLLRVVGIAETNNGPNHPTCFDATGETLFTLDFLVTDDRTFECMYVPIRFFWLDCGDNTVSYHESADTDNPYSQRLAISRDVWDFEGAMEMSDGSATFPTYLGAPDVCLEGDKDEPVRFIDFINGGIDIVCADSIDDRGDINLNGQAYEISDAVLYSNYFVFGMGVFDAATYQASVAASDVNADGLPLSVADLVYLIRVVVGDASPYPKLAPVAANITTSGSILASDIDLGAAYVVVEGQASPELLIDGVKMYSNFDAAENVTRVLVVGMEVGAAISGEFLNADGNIVSMEMATYDGAPVNAKITPDAFALNQNFPNPFNPSTTVSFALPTASDYTMTIYNVTGQVVRTISDKAEAGTVELNIDLSDQASGIYFYSVDAGEFSATKKMVLVK